MIRLLAYLPILIAVGLTIFTMIDIALIDRSRVKGPPKLVWILISLVVVIGPVIWFLLGRERLIDASQAGGSFGPRPRRGPPAPDDDTEFLGKLGRETAQEKRIRDLEERLREMDGDPDDKSKE